MTEQKNELYQEIEAWAQNAILHSPTWSLTNLTIPKKALPLLR